MSSELSLSNFYPRPPCGGRPNGWAWRQSDECISIHALRAEGDAIYVTAKMQRIAFLSTPSVRRATGGICPSAGRPGNFYPRPPCGGRLSYGKGYTYAKEISIHALRAEGDRVRHRRPARHRISIHALRAEGDPGCWQRRADGHRFLSTPSVRRATPAAGVPRSQS